MRKRQAASFILCLLLAVLLTACGGQETRENAESVTRETEAERNVAQGEEQFHAPDNGSPGGRPVTQVERMEAGEDRTDAEDDTDSEDDAEAESEAEEEDPVTDGLGRILFIGDSRTIDLFADSDTNLTNEIHDDIHVYAGHGRGFDYFVSVIRDFGTENFDTLVTWMGANDDGNYPPYTDYYDTLLFQGKKIIVCTIGPCGVGDAYENRFYPKYANERMRVFNTGLVEWASSRDVQVIDLYTYIVQNVRIDPDGIHYLPRPTSAVWNRILEELGLAE